MVAKTVRAGRASHGRKTTFILAQAPDVPAKELVALAKRAGLTFTQSYVYKVRGRSESQGVTTAPKAGPSRSAGATTGLRLSSNDIHEQAILNALEAIGVARARAVFASYEKLVGHEQGRIDPIGQVGP